MIARREVELKLQLDMASIDMLAAAPALANVKIQQQAQISTYFDTLEQALHKAGLSLRVRAVGNAAQMQRIGVNPAPLHDASESLRHSNVRCKAAEHPLPLSCYSRAWLLS